MASKFPWNKFFVIAGILFSVAAILLHPAIKPWVADSYHYYSYKTDTINNDSNVITLQIIGMTCIGCANKIKKNFSGLTGIQKMHINPVTGGGILLASQKTDQDKLVKVIANSGYSVTIK